MSLYHRIDPDGAVVGEVECIGLAQAYARLDVRAGEFVRQAANNGEQRARREPALRACPFCGSRNLYLGESERRSAMRRFAIANQVVAASVRCRCQDCGAVGPRGRWRSEAVMASYPQT
mgnify:CR=1 FL=1